MTLYSKTILAGSAFVSLFAMGQAEALVDPVAKKPASTSQASAQVDNGPAGAAQSSTSNPPVGYEGLNSTYIYTAAKEIAGVYQTSKSPDEALKRFCGKEMIGLKPGYFREKSGYRCDLTASGAVIALNICWEFAGFDGSDCAQKAKKLLWPRAPKTAKLVDLMKSKIGIPLTDEEVIGQEQNKFRQVIDKTQITNARTPYEDMMYYAFPGGIDKYPEFKLTNTLFVLCTYDKNLGAFSPRRNLSGNLLQIAKTACPAAKALVAASKAENPSGKMLEQGPSLIPLGQEPKTALGKIKIEESPRPNDRIQAQGALRDLDKGRDNLDSDGAYSGAVGNLDDSKMANASQKGSVLNGTLKSAPKMGVSNQERFAQKANPSLSSVELDPQTALVVANIELDLKSIEKEIADKKAIWEKKKADAVVKKEIGNAVGKLMRYLDEVAVIIQDAEAVNNLAAVEYVNRSYVQIINLANRLYPVLDDYSRNSLKVRLAKYKIMFNEKGIFYKASTAPVAPTGPLKTPAWMTNDKAVKGIQDRRQGQGNVQGNQTQDNMSWEEAEQMMNQPSARR